MYRLKISREVNRTIDRLPGNVRQRIRQAIAGLTRDPRPPNAKLMTGDLSGYYRLRLENYRIIYTVDDEIVVVELFRVAKRTSRTYDDLP